jgi:hypothetical protein
MHVLEHVLARSFKESQSQRHSNAEQPRSGWSPALHILLLPTITTPPTFSDTVDGHS